MLGVFYARFPPREASIYPQKKGRRALRAFFSAKSHPPPSSRRFEIADQPPIYLNPPASRRRVGARCVGWGFSIFEVLEVKTLSAADVAGRNCNCQ